MKKVILVTGSTDGIGKVAAIKLAKDGHEVILHGRNQEKLNTTIEEVKSKSDHNEIQGFVSDFSELNNVIRLSQQLNENLPQLDVLINNAGVYNSKATKNVAGLDMRFAVNYFAPYLLTQSLLQLISTSSDPRIINLSSAAQQSVDLPALTGVESITESSSYAQSKLALTMWSFHLGTQYPNFTIIPVNPGSLLDTKMVREAFGRIWGTAEKGANILCDLATSEKYKGVTGKYFDNDLGNPKGRFGDAHVEAYDQDLIAALIEQTGEVISSIKD